VDPNLASIPGRLPGRDRGSNLRLAVQAAVQALSVQDAEFRLRHVQPTAMLGRVVELDPVQEVSGLLRRERLVQAPPAVRVQVVLD